MFFLSVSKRIYYLLYKASSRVQICWRRLESEDILDEDDLDAVGVEGVGLANDLVVNDGRGGDTVSVTGAGRLSSPGELVSALVSLLLVLDNLVGSSKDNDVAGTEGNTTDLGAREITVDQETVLRDSGD